ncbi:MAG TPA: hypothetical protein PKL49_09640 [Steroidobacteraceae bacterium]|jgi:hypothetical protein|nr:hypothetical protein [Steroidobacteraceae bacterium]
MNALAFVIVAIAACSVLWQLVPARARYKALRALQAALPQRGYAARIGHGIIAPLVRRAAKGLGGGCGGCPANSANAASQARHARPPH